MENAFQMSTPMSMGSSTLPFKLVRYLIFAEGRFYVLYVDYFVLWVALKNLTGPKLF